MKHNTEKGAFIEWLLMFFAISVVIFAIVIPKNKRFVFNLNPMTTQSTVGNNWTLGVSGSNNSSIGNVTPSTAPSSAIAISTGNAPYTTDPTSEYVTIENRGNSSIDITGWRLENGKNLRAYAAGDREVHYASDTGIIPQGAKIVSPSGSTILGDIVLKPNERVIVTTGSPGNLSSFPLVSFKENECTAYLSDTYNFASGLDMSCVRPSSEIGTQNLDLSCQNFIDTLQSCRLPKFNAVDSQGHTTDSRGNTCNGCINGKVGLSSVCQNFIKEHYSYQGCLANHSGDTNFEGTTWHVYLYKPWEMWAANHEVVSLYDSQNRLITQHSY